jgi:hypothetical protein
MIDIGSTNFLIKVPSLPKDEFEHYSNKLFDEWDRVVEQTLVLPDYSLFLEVEEGSINGRGKIAAALGVLYFGIGNYGDFISGIETIRGQVSFVSNALFETAKSSFECNNLSGTMKKNGGALSRLSRLFDKVQRGTLTTEQAMTEAKALFGEEVNEVPDFIPELRRQFENAPRFPKQLSLIDEEWEESIEKPIGQEKKLPRIPIPKPTPMHHHYRIEIWRESKKDKKLIKIKKL